MARDQRRLAAIVSADVAGYSRLMGRDDSRTLANLKAHRRELIDPKIAEYGGRIVKTTGDGLLLEFPSVVDAVRCAVDVQRGMADRNVNVPDDERIDFRVGINVGDIIIDGDDIFGDGVNVAARLQGLAEAGGVCVSKVVRDQVLDKLNFTFDELGERHVKNIVRPVDVYRIDLGGAARPPRAAQDLARRWRASRWPWLASVALVALAGAGGWWLWSAATSARSAALPMFSIGVLPFDASGAVVAQSQLADAVYTDLTSSLARSLPFGYVAAPGVVAAYKGKAIDLRAVGRDLKVRYVVEGSVRFAGERAVINARLTEAGAGSQVWGGDVELEPAADVQARQAMISRLTNQVKGAMFDAEYRRVKAAPLSALNAEELTLRGDVTWERASEPSRAALMEARSMYDRALKLNPTLPAALMGQANLLQYALDYRMEPDRDRLLREYDQLSMRLVSASDQEARAWNIRADVLHKQFRWEAALEANARAARIDPARLGTMGQLADLLIDMGRPEEALAAIDRAFTLHPTGHASWFSLLRCRANMALGKYAEASAECEKAAAEGDAWPPAVSPHLFLVAAYAQQGNEGHLAAEKTRLLAQRPGVSIADVDAERTSDVPAYLQQAQTHLYAGLRKAGIPDR